MGIIYPYNHFFKFTAEFISAEIRQLEEKTEHQKYFLYHTLKILQIKN